MPDDSSHPDGAGHHEGDGGHDSQQPPEQRPSRSGRAQADHEFKLAILVALPMLIIGQLMLLVGWWWPAMLLVALPGSVGSVLLIRRWQRLSAPSR